MTEVSSESGSSCIEPSVRCPRLLGFTCVTTAAAITADRHRRFARSAFTDSPRTDRVIAETAASIGVVTALARDAMLGVAEKSECPAPAEDGICAQTPAMDAVIEAMQLAMPKES